MGSRYNLTVAQIGEEDYGIYECIATNSLGRSAGTVELTGKERSIAQEGLYKRESSLDNPTFR
mgnify:CR=1 FL=1